MKRDSGLVILNAAVVGALQAAEEEAAMTISNKTIVGVPQTNVILIDNNGDSRVDQVQIVDSQDSGNPGYLERFFGSTSCWEAQSGSQQTELDYLIGSNVDDAAKFLKLLVRVEKDRGGQDPENSFICAQSAEREYRLAYLALSMGISDRCLGKDLAERCQTLRREPSLIKLFADEQARPLGRQEVLCRAEELCVKIEFENDRRTEFPCFSYYSGHSRGPYLLNREALDLLGTLCRDIEDPQVSPKTRARVLNMLSQAVAKRIHDQLKCIDEICYRTEAGQKNPGSFDRTPTAAFGLRSQFWDDLARQLLILPVELRAGLFNQYKNNYGLELTQRIKAGALESMRIERERKAAVGFVDDEAGLSKRIADLEKTCL